MPDTLAGIPKEPPKGSFYDLTSDEDQGAQKRKRGGQPGNQNARKHGLFSKHFTPDQAKQIEDAGDLKDLGPEIALLRIKLNTLLNDPEVSPLNSSSAPSIPSPGSYPSSVATFTVNAPFVFTTANYEFPITKENTTRFHHTAKRVTELPENESSRLYSNPCGPKAGYPHPH